MNVPQGACRTANEPGEAGGLAGSCEPIIVDSIQSLVCELFAVLVIRSAEGNSGIGLAKPFAPATMDLVDAIGREFVVGSDIRDLHHIMQRAREQSKTTCDLLLNEALAWLELALLDLAGRSLSCSVAEILGGVHRRRIPLYLSSSRRRLAPEVELEGISRQLEMTGIRAVKLKVGVNKHRGDDIERSSRRVERFVPLARKHFGDNIVLYIDANGCFSVERAIEVASVLSDNGVAWFEEPCPYGDHRALEQVARQVAVPIAWGERESRLSEFQRVLDTGLCSVAQPDLWRLGGLFGARAVSRSAAACGIPTTIHHPGGQLGYIYTLHFASSTADPGTFQEYRGGLAYSAGWFDPPLEIAGGHLDLPRGNGFGLALSADRVLRRVKAVCLRSKFARFKGRVSSFLGR